MYILCMQVLDTEKLKCQSALKIQHRPNRLVCQRSSVSCQLLAESDSDRQLQLRRSHGLDHHGQVEGVSDVEKGD